MNRLYLIFCILLFQCDGEDNVPIIEYVDCSIVEYEVMNSNGALIYTDSIPGVNLESKQYFILDRTNVLPLQICNVKSISFLKEENDTIYVNYKGVKEPLFYTDAFAEQLLLKDISMRFFN